MGCIFASFTGRLQCRSVSTISYSITMHQDSQSNLEEKISELFNAAHSHTLPPLVHPPTLRSRVHALWDTRVCAFQVHERRAEILLSLGTLAQDVQTARTLSQPGCGLTLLERLERTINNYLHVVKLLHGEVRMISSTLCCGACGSDWRKVILQVCVL